MPATPLRHLYAIDALRFVAALAVLTHHGWWVAIPAVKALPLYPEFIGRYGGQLGVSLFFMISGFVILMSAQNQTARSFGAARVARLYPAFWICCLLTALILRKPPTLAELAANLTMFPSLFGVRLLDGVYWTLLVEAQFYVLIAALLALKRLASIQPVLLGWLLLSLLAQDPLSRSVLIADYAALFIGGCACFLLRQAWSADRLVLFSLAAVAAVLEAFGQAQHAAVVLKVADQSLAVALCVAGCWAVMLALARGWLKVPAVPGLATLGAISYPLYLLHKEIGYWLLSAAPREPWVFAAVLGIVLALAWVVTLLEQPARRWLKGRLAGRSA